MVLTPTYYVFKMYREHQDAELLESRLENAQTGMDGCKIPVVSHSASVNKNGDVLVTFSNCSLDEDYEIEINGAGARSVSGEILTAEIHANEIFEEAENRLHAQKAVMVKLMG